MAAHTGQDRFVALFLVTLAIASIGIAFFFSAVGKLLVVLGFLGLLASLAGIFSIRPLEGKSSRKVRPPLLLVPTRQPQTNTQLPVTSQGQAPTQALRSERPGRKTHGVP